MSFFALIRGGNRFPLERKKPMDEKIIATYCLCDDLGRVDEFRRYRYISSIIHDMEEPDVCTSVAD
jgi:hypothetical protein